MDIDKVTPSDKLDILLGHPCETEWLEFKEAKTSYGLDDLGKYFSGLSNEAFLKGREYAWLVFGVRDDGSVCGSTYREEQSALQRLKQEVASHNSGGVSFENIHEVKHPQGRVVMFQIPAATRGMPTDWKGHWYGRNGESLVPLSLRKLLRIVSDSSDVTDLDHFENYLLDYDNWKYDGVESAVYLRDANFVIRIEDAEEQCGAANYWWGRLFHEEPVALSYRLICKGQEIHRVLVLLFQNECLKVTFPKVETLASPTPDQTGRSVGFYADVFYYQEDSIEYKLLCHIRALGASPRSSTPLFSPLKSQVKPPIIELPFPILKNSEKVELLLNEVTQSLPDFNTQNEQHVTSIRRGGAKERMEVEKIFSWWVQRVWENSG